MKSIIIYASKYGTAEKCAKLISEGLEGQVDLIDIKHDKKIDFSSYDNVIIGGSIYMGKIHKSINEFCKANVGNLSKKRLGLFICGMAEGEAIEKEIKDNYPAELIEVAVIKDCLGGEFMLDKMNLMDKTIAKKVSKATTNQSNISYEKIDKFINAMNTSDN